jgi:pimeloyl-ACP methyl ester carboxylesterase
VIALQLALDAPDRIHSMALLEAAILTVPSMQLMMNGLVATAGLHQQGKKEEAVDMFEMAVAGPDYRRMLDERIPGAFAQMVADSGTFFQQEIPALQTWSFTAQAAGRIQTPTLVVLAEGSGALWPGFAEGHTLLMEWLPQAEGFVLPGATACAAGAESERRSRSAE